MVIYINISNVVDDAGAVYLMESGSSDPIPPKGKLIQSLNEANGRLMLMLERFLSTGCQPSAEDSQGVCETLRYELRFSPRRAAGKAQSLADQMHAFLVEATLAKCYASMGLAEQAARHDAQAVSAAEVIRQLIHSKIPPM